MPSVPHCCVLGSGFAGAGGGGGGSCPDYVP